MERKSFLQSPEWGEFQRELGHEPRIVGTSTQCYIVRSKLFSYLYVPRGPVVKNHEEAALFLNELKQEASKLLVDYILVEPEIHFTPFLSLLKEHGFVVHKQSIQPAMSLILSLSPDIETLFASLRKTTRAEVRRAQKENITVSSSNTLDRWDSFTKLLSETTERQKFFGHPPNYLKKQFETFVKTNSAKLYLAEIERNVVAAAIIVYSSHTATYLHAASSHVGRKSGAPHLLVWTAIQNAKEAGLTEFDFWGIAPENIPDHPWVGITIFKKGFGGTVVTYPGSFAFPVHRMKYNLYLLMTFLRTIPVFKAAQRILLRMRTGG